MSVRRQSSVPRLVMQEMQARILRPLETQRVGPTSRGRPPQHLQLQCMPIELAVGRSKKQVPCPKGAGVALALNHCATSSIMSGKVLSRGAASAKAGM
mgnify:CR=1 FL=1